VHGLLKSERGNERGFSLIEMMVASAIFAIAAAVAFILYSAAQKSYKAGENFTDQQQSTRVAFDRMVSDIRLAGFNSNPDGDNTRNDEQIEGAWDTAVTIRGDFDFEDPVASTTPEASLPGAVYNVVSTGNDEIVTYVLAKPGPTGPDTLTFRLDADKPRTKTLKTIIIPNVVLVQNNPPYTLYRVTLADVNGAFPLSPQAATNFVYEPVAENIRTMTFLYYDDSGALVNPNTPANSADDIGGSDANITNRGRIRRIAVSIVGMTHSEDLDYTDPADASATSHYRKFDLTSDVTPVNLGKTGVKDIDVTPPPPPTNVSIVNGHCGGTLVKWDQPSSSSGTTGYVVKFWPNGTPNSFLTRAFTYPHMEYGSVDYLGHAFVSGLTTGSNYCFQVLAKDLAGNQSSWAPSTSPPCGQVTNSTTPGVPQSLTASYFSTSAAMPATLDGKVQLNWNELQVNTVATSLSGDPNSIGGATILRDLAGYKLYRDVTSTFSTPTLVPTSLPVGTLAFQDIVPACQDFFYKVSAVDLCGTEGAQSAIATGRANTLYSPVAPTGVTATRLDPNTIRVTWTAVTTNTASPALPIAVDQYKIYRAVGSTSSSPNDPLLAYTYVGTATATTPPPTYDDNIISIKNDLKTQAAFYKVSALDYCPNESAQSSGALATCIFTGTISFSPPDNSSGGGDIPITLAILGGTDPSYTGRVHIARDTDGYGPADFLFPSITSTPSTATWLQTTNDTGVYTITYEVDNSVGCIATATAKYTRTNSLPCKLTAAGATLTPTSGGLKTNILTLNLTNTYTKGLDINKITPSWTNPGSHVLDEIDLPTSPLTSFCGPGAAKASGVGCTPTFLAPQITAGATNGTRNVWTTSMAGETITLKYDFTDTTGLAGVCTFCVSPAQTITVSTSGTCP
jgi:prepilin-type N-terminal cleavage/methylation domain-containing protein